MQPDTLFYRFGVALFIGILVGLQREYAGDAAFPTRDERRVEMFAGVRTFALLALAGCAAALVAETLDSAWGFVSVVVPLGLLITAAYFITAWRGEAGMTTEVAAVVTILAGALCYWDQLPLAVALGVATTALLSFKLELHGFVARLQREDIVAALKFAIISAIILPVLPDSPLGPPPFDVLNPYKIWLMVVFISGISFSGYVLIKLVGAQRGIGLTGLLGGLASSTATTLSFAQRSQRDVILARPFALAITLAWTIMFVRVLIAVQVVNAALLPVVWLPVVAAAVAGLAYCVYLYFGSGAHEGEEVKVSNPMELGPAITFGLLYGLVLLISSAAQFYFGNTGVYISSLVSGLADVDAVTLSVAELNNAGNLDATTAAQSIVLAAMANTVAKGGIVLSSGSAALRRAILPALLLILVTGISAAFLF